jgi:hypothetical protein
MIDKHAALEWAFETATEVVLVKEISQENDSIIMECLIKHNWPFVKSLIENNKSLSPENKRNTIDWLEHHKENHGKD